MRHSIPSYREVHHHKSRVRSLAAVSNTIWSGGSEGMIAVHDHLTLNLIADLRVPTPYARESLSSVNHSVTAILPIGAQAVWAGTSSGSIAVWDAQKHTLIYEFKPHEKDICCLCLSTDGNSVWCGSADHTISVWDVKTYELKHKLIGHTNWVRCAVAVPENENTPASIWTGGDDASVRLWDQSTGKCWKTTSGHSGGVLCGVMVPASRRPTRALHTRDIWDRSNIPSDVALIWTGSCDHTIRVWHSRTTALVLELTGHSGWVSSLRVVASGEYVVSGSSDRTMRIWSSSDGQCLAAFDAHSGWVTSLTSIGLDVWSGGSDVVLRSWDLSKDRDAYEGDGGESDGVTGPRDPPRKPRVSMTASFVGAIAPPARTPYNHNLSRSMHTTPMPQWDVDRQRFMTPAAAPPPSSTPMKMRSSGLDLDTSIASVHRQQQQQARTPLTAPPRSVDDEKWVWNMETQSFVPQEQPQPRPTPQPVQHEPETQWVEERDLPVRDVSSVVQVEGEQVTEMPMSVNDVEEVVEEGSEVDGKEEEEEDAVESIGNHALSLAVAEAEAARTKLELSEANKKLLLEQERAMALQQEAEVMRVALDEVMKRNDALEEEHLLHAEAEAGAEAAADTTTTTATVGTSVTPSRVAVPVTDHAECDMRIQRLEEQVRESRQESSSVSQRLDAVLRELQEQLKQATADRLAMSQMKGELDDARRVISEANDDSERWREREEEAERGIADLQIALTQLRSDLQESEGKAQAQATDRDQMVDRLRKLESELRSAQRAAEEEKDARKKVQLDRDRLSSELADARERVQELEKSIDARVSMRVEEEKELMRKRSTPMPAMHRAAPAAAPAATATPGLSTKMQADLRRARETLNASLVSSPLAQTAQTTQMGMGTPRMYRTGRWDNDFDARYNNVLTPSRGIGLGTRFNDIPVDGSPRDVAEALARRFDIELGEMRKRLGGQSRALAALERSRVAMASDLKSAWDLPVQGVDAEPLASAESEDVSASGVNYDDDNDDQLQDVLNRSRQALADLNQ